MVPSTSFMKLSSDEIQTLLCNGTVNVTVVGLGWMGVATTALFLDVGSKVICTDKDPITVNALCEGKPSRPEPGTALIFEKAFRDGRLSATTDSKKAASQSDVIIFTVPTMASKEEADYTALLNASRNVGMGLRGGSCIIGMSTCAPTITEREVKPILEKYSGLKAGSDFVLAHSPIRAMTGKALEDMRNYSRVVGTYNPDNLHIVKAVLSSVTKGTIRSMSSITAAEASKIFETVYRDVNIALANEFALLCEQLGIDYYETMKAANSQPYSHLHRPSVGVGGHCIPVYPYLLLDLAKDIGIKLRLVKEARRINEFAPKRVVHLAAAALRELGKPLARSRIAILGLSYRENVKELRLSPTLDLISLLLKRGANITIYDPNFQLTEIRNLGYNIEVATTIQSALKDVHCTVIMVAHDEFRSLTPADLAAYIGGSASIIDGPGIFTPMEIKRVGLVYRGIGKGVVQ